MDRLCHPMGAVSENYFGQAAENREISMADLYDHTKRKRNTLDKIGSFCLTSGNFVSVHFSASLPGWGYKV